MVVSYDHIKGYEDREEKIVPIEDIGMVVLEHRQITLSQYLLDKLIENNASVIICNETHHPSAMLMPLESNTLQSERFKAQIEATEPLKKQLWQQTVKAKINNQSSVLKKWNIPNNRLNTLAQNVKSGDADNNEATAAAYYWSNLLPPAWQFFRRHDGPPPNNLFNYGYAIIRATIARALAGAGLLNTLGIHHRNRYNAFCLADDIMEPYRPFADIIVRTIIDETSVVDTLTLQLKTLLLKLPAMDVMMEEQKKPLMIAAHRTATSLSKCYSGEQRKILYPEVP